MVTLAVRLIVLIALAATRLTAAEITGRVTTANGPAGIQHATVELLHVRLVIAERNIGTDGRFEFRGINNGNYDLRIRSHGYHEELIAVILPTTSSREVLEVKLRPVESTPVGPPTTVSVRDLKIPDAAKREYQKGVEERQRNQCAKAIPHFDKAIAAFSTYGEAYNELGNCLKETENLAKAETAFRKAIEYTTSVYPSMNLADLYASQKRYSEGYEVLKSAITAYPGEGDPYFALAKLHFDQSQFKESLAAGLQAHSKTHRMADVHILLAKIYLSLQDYPALTAQLRLYLEESPKGPMADQVRKNLAAMSSAGGK
jgi:tetratricopeptide (TPR) repeat protein